MQKGLIFSALFVLACHPQPAPVPERCAPAPASAAPFTRASYGQLVGDFKVVQITTNREGTVPPLVRTIHLYANDSLHRYRYEVPQIGRTRGERPVAGWVEAPGTSYWNDSAVRSQDPERPGIQWAAGRLRIGQVDVMDGIGDDLEVSTIAASGFWGSWSRDWGMAAVMEVATGKVLPSEAGYFCAVRITRPDSGAGA